MMQISDSYNQKNSLFNAMNRFIGAVNNMDQTVMVPSLLRDVPQDHGQEPRLPEGGARTPRACFQQEDGDMYSSYVLLKSIRNDIEWGVLRGDGPLRGEGAARAGVGVGTGGIVGTEAGGGPPGEKAGPEEAPPGEGDLEKQFHFHLSGLHAVLSKLTLKANTLTNRYKEEVGCRN